MGEVRKIRSASSVRFDEALNDPTLIAYEQINFYDETPEHLTSDQVKRLIDMTPYELKFDLVRTYQITEAQADSIVEEMLDINRDPN